VGALDVVDAEGIIMRSGCGRLFVDGIDEIERVAGVVAFVSFGLDPDGEELGSKIARLCFVEADVAESLGSVDPMS